MGSYLNLVEWMKSLTKRQIPAVRESLAGPAAAYSANLGRIICLGALGALIEEAARRVQYYADLARFRVTGTVEPIDFEEALDRRIREEMSKIAIAEGEKQELTGDGKEFLQGSAQNIDLLFTDTQVIEGLNAAMASMIIAAWTAFETLSGDLLEAAVNNSPQLLLKLEGHKGRIGKKSGGELKDKGQDDGAQADKRGPSVSFSEIHKVTRGTFKMDGHWGSLIRARLRFATLAGIRQSYSVVFHDRHDRIDEILSRKSLNSLAVVRNALIHAAGKADGDYIEDLKNAPQAPVLKIGEPLVLNGKLVGEIVEPVIIAGMDLIDAVEIWLLES